MDLSAIPIIDEFKRIMRFGFVGIIATAIHMVVALSCKYYFSAPPQLANIIGFMIAFIFSFTGQYFWTFKSKASLPKAILKFFLVAFSGYLISAFLLFTLSEISVFNDYYNLVVSIFIIPLITYFAGKYYAFK